MQQDFGVSAATVSRFLASFCDKCPPSWNNNQVTDDDDVTREVALTLAVDVDAPAVARRFVSEHGASLPPELLDDARLLVSELVGNAVRYGRAEISLSVRARPPGIGVAVADSGEEMPVLPSGRPDPTRASGRGLLIVAAVASSWGIDPLVPGPGKTVWFELHP